MPNATADALCSTANAQHPFIALLQSPGRCVPCNHEAWGGWFLAAALIGIPLIVAGFIWLIVDMFRLPSMVRAANAWRGF
ncbi:hypothetical protein ACWPKO_23780 (plasmid) [Coraliomargarita sp. W4R53]